MAVFRFGTILGALETQLQFKQHDKLRLQDGCICVSLLLQCLQNQSSDIRLVSERVLWWVWREPATPCLEAALMKPLLKSLLDNTKDKNTGVRAQSEHTIVNLLQLRRGDDTMQVGWAARPYTHTHTQ